VRSTALVSDEKRIRGVHRTRRCAIQIDNLYLYLLPSLNTKHHLYVQNTQKWHYDADRHVWRCYLGNPSMQNVIEMIDSLDCSVEMRVCTRKWLCFCWRVVLVHVALQRLNRLLHLRDDHSLTRWGGNMPRKYVWNISGIANRSKTNLE